MNTKTFCWETPPVYANQFQLFTFATFFFSIADVMHHPLPRISGHGTVAELKSLSLIFWPARLKSASTLCRTNFAISLAVIGLPKVLDQNMWKHVETWEALP